MGIRKARTATNRSGLGIKKPSHGFNDMPESITGGKPSSNSTPSKNSGIVCPEREKRWAAQLAESRLKKAESSSVDLAVYSHPDFNTVDKSTGELVKRSADELRESARVGVDPDVIQKGKVRRFRHDRDEAAMLRYQTSDAGVLLKRLYLADEAEKRAQGFKDVFGVNGMIAKKPLPVKGCSGLEYLKDWSDTRLVSEITVGAQDVFISSTLRGGRDQVGGGVRQKIVEWSKQSRSRCERHIRNVEDGTIRAFLTLTYPDEYTNDGVRIKRDLATMIKRLKRMGVDGGIWFLEFQNRGAPHFHCFLNKWPKSGVSGVAHAWFEVVGSGDQKHLDWHLGKLSGRPCLEWMRKPHAASYYACKYAVKAEQKSVPELYQNVGRFWGYWGDMKPVYQTYYARGSESSARAVKMIATWKLEQFGGVVGADLVLYSATLRGCGPMQLNELFQSSGWCPD